MARVRLSEREHQCRRSLLLMVVKRRPTKSCEGRNTSAHPDIETAPIVSCEFLGHERSHDSISLAETARSYIRRAADRFTRNHQFDAPVLLTACRIVIGGYRRSIS